MKPNFAGGNRESAQNMDASRRKSHSTQYPVPTSKVPDLIDMWARETPNRRALEGITRSFSWQEFAKATVLAAESLHRAGVVAGDRIPVISENSVSSIILFVGLQRLQAWPAIINARLPRVEVSALISCAAARFVLHSAEESPATAEHVDSFSALPLLIDGLADVYIHRHDNQAVAEATSTVPSQEVATLMFTSGTTGIPKAVMLSHENLIGLGQIVGTGRGTSAGDTINVAAPLSHIMGLASVMPAIVFGATARLAPRLDPSDLATSIASGSLNQISMVPTGYVRLLDKIHRDRIDVSGHKLRTMVSGGAPLDPGLKSRVEQTFGIPLVNGYGMTECAAISRSRASFDSPAWGVGKPEAGVRVRIVDGLGCDAPPGETGEIWARSPCVMLGYFRNPAATAEVMRDDGWYATGDMGHLLPGGEIILVGRTKEMIIHSGFNVYPAEVEAAINDHPDVLQSAIFGLPAADADEEVVAWVQLKPESALVTGFEAALRSHVRQRLAPYKCPSRFFVIDSMPLGSSGKILKKDLLGRTPPCL